jgi:hypothetical protein
MDMPHREFVRSMEQTFVRSFGYKQERDKTQTSRRTRILLRGSIESRKRIAFSPRFRDPILALRSQNGNDHWKRRVICSADVAVSLDGLSESGRRYGIPAL